MSWLGSEAFGMWLTSCRNCRRMAIRWKYWPQWSISRYSARNLPLRSGERDPAKGGHPGFDPVLKFRMLVLQKMHGLSLDQTEYLLRNRLSWMRFCGLGPGDQVPDANTLDICEALIDRLNRAITDAGYLPMSGQIVDATLVAAPRQRNTGHGKGQIKEGKTAKEIWPEKPARARQKDTDARWTVKFTKAKLAEDGSKQVDIAILTFGYKSHVSMDRRHGVTAAR